MSYTIARLIDHLDIRVSDFDAAGPFYRAVFGALGLGAEVDEGEDYLALDELYISRADPGAPPSHMHLCFQAGSRESVAAFHAAGLAAGGRDNGGPGLRDYHPGYYAAFLLDSDGNNIEAKVDERVTARSADAVHLQTE
ncbi:VOC family protein [Pseudoroseicyclus tamaricis]|uniref:VOC family protein n=1 Tax=Pseudoroseicyclus tamaricis TaxID=2705421 RepID=A0A6B2K1G2_9RHOB|nr:VOC family protein [Pseudoroseicyclus tamaricis]NDV02304.1 VOC family protein [Pseudoroseicyclus tamaricis]